MPAYTYRSTGSVDFNATAAPLSPGAPAGLTDGDLMLLATGHRDGAETVAAMTGWTQLAAHTVQGSLEIWAHVADGVDDAPSVDWSGNDNVFAFMDAFFGDVFTDLTDIVAHSVTLENSSADIPLEFLTITTNDTLVYAVGRKNAGSAGDATDITVPGSLTERGEYIGTAFTHFCASASVQQTTAVNYNGDNMTIDGTSQSTSTNNAVLSLKTQSGAIFLPASHSQSMVRF